MFGYDPRDRVMPMSSWVAGLKERIGKQCRCPGCHLSRVEKMATIIGIDPGLIVKVVQ